MPLSPILEYAIKEKEEKYLLQENDSNSVACVSDKTSKYAHDKHDFDYYVKCFSNLSVGLANGRKLPHKAVLLLTVFTLFENGQIEGNTIPINNILSKAFAAQWSKFFGDIKVPSVWVPFWYMKSEPFWHFRSNDCDDVLAALLSFAGHPSKGQMQPVIRCAYLDKALCDYLENDSCKEKLQEILIETYINPSLSHS